MDLSDPVLAHQQVAVQKLAKEFERVTVLTGKVGEIYVPDNVRVINCLWVVGKRGRSSLRYLIKALGVLFRDDISVVFTHMADVYAALISPILKTLRIKHVLWYAHANKSVFLRFSSIFVDQIVTSTSGSCPISGIKVTPIGQAIDAEVFTPFISRDYSSKTKLVHIGRFDKSKRIDELINAASKLRINYSNITLTIIGNPSNSSSQKYAQTLIKNNFHNSDWLTFLPSVRRTSIPEIISQFDVFFHGYMGSLDKTLVESALLEIPIVSVNSEYLSEFGAWGTTDRLTLETEYESMVRRTPDSVASTVKSRKLIAISRHSENNWIRKLTEILKDQRNGYD